MTSREDRGWNPYVAGVLAGVLIVLSAYFTGNYFGASSSFVRTAGQIEKFFGPAHVARTSYFMHYAPHLDWQWFFLVGVCLGAFIAALLSRDFAWRGMPPMWAARFGPGAPLRAGAAFAGGFVMLVGARIAGGCTSGHGLSGSLQLSVGGLITLAAIFAGGILSAGLLYHGGPRR